MLMPLPMLFLLLLLAGSDDGDSGCDKICVALNGLNSLSTTNDEKMCKSLT